MSNVCVRERLSVVKSEQYLLKKILNSIGYCIFSIISGGDKILRNPELDYRGRRWGFLIFDLTQSIEK